MIKVRPPSICAFGDSDERAGWRVAARLGSLPTDEVVRAEVGTGANKHRQPLICGAVIYAALDWKTPSFCENDRGVVGGLFLPWLCQIPRNAGRATTVNRFRSRSPEVPRGESNVGRSAPFSFRPKAWPGHAPPTVLPTG